MLSGAQLCLTLSLIFVFLFCLISNYLHALLFFNSYSNFLYSSHFFLALFLISFPYISRIAQDPAPRWARCFKLHDTAESDSALLHTARNSPLLNTVLHRVEFCKYTVYSFPCTPIVVWKGIIIRQQQLPGTLYCILWMWHIFSRKGTFISLVLVVSSSQIKHYFIQTTRTIQQKCF